jgi:hypothetical protein
MRPQLASAGVGSISKGWRLAFLGEFQSSPSKTVLVWKVSKVAETEQGSRSVDVKRQLYAIDQMTRSLHQSLPQGHGCETNISIPRSTVTRWPRSRAGLPKMASNTCARTQAQCCVRTQGSCSLPLQTTGGLRAGWHSLDGLGLLGTRAAFSSPSVGGLRSSRAAVKSGGIVFTAPGIVPALSLLSRIGLAELGKLAIPAAISS